MRKDVEYFATTADVATRLSNGFIKYKGQFFYCIGSHGWNIILRELTEKGREFNVDILKEIHNIELGRPKIGFFNLANNAYWSSVLPQRQYTQVLMPRMIALDAIVSGINRTYLNQWRMENYVDSLNGKYPSVKTIEEKLNRGDISSAAFSRNFALSQFTKKDGKPQRMLYHRNNIIGYYDFGGKVYHIQPSFDTPLLTTILIKNGINYVVD